MQLPVSQTGTVDEREYTSICMPQDLPVAGVGPISPTASYNSSGLE